jgi:hypothetical protein
MRTFVVRVDPTGNLHPPAIVHIARRRLQEEERFLWGGVAKLLRVRGIVPANGYNLARVEDSNQGLSMGGAPSCRA